MIDDACFFNQTFIDPFLAVSNSPNVNCIWQCMCFACSFLFGTSKKLFLFFFFFLFSYPLCSRSSSLAPIYALYIQANNNRERERARRIDLFFSLSLVRLSVRIWQRRMCSLGIDISFPILFPSSSDKANNLSFFFL